MMLPSMHHQRRPLLKYFAALKAQFSWPFTVNFHVSFQQTTPVNKNHHYFQNSHKKEISKNFVNEKDQNFLH